MKLSYLVTYAIPIGVIVNVQYESPKLDFTKSAQINQKGQITYEVVQKLCLTPP